MVLYIGDWFTVLAMFLLAGEASDDSPLAIAGVLAHAHAAGAHVATAGLEEVLQGALWSLRVRAARKAFERRSRKVQK